MDKILTSLSRRQFGIGLTTAMGAAALTSSASWAASAGGGIGAAVHKVGLAEQQAVITQRIPMCAGFIKLNVEPSRFLVNIEEAATRFENVLVGFRNGDADLELEAETNGEILESLSAVEAVWPAMRDAVAKIVDSEFVDDADYETIARANSALLFMSENVEKRIVSVYGDSGDHLSVLIAVELAARQEMLTQKMSKEITTIALGYKPVETRKILTETIGLYENSLNALIGGVEALTLPPPPEHIRLALLEEKSRWSDLSPIMRGIAEGGEAGLLELYAIASQEEALQEAAKHIEHMYREAGAAQG